MIQMVKKSEQYNANIFNGNFVVNKPVANVNKTSVQPYSNLFYWSHGYTLQNIEFGLHPHEGFEIMTFILEGNISHYDTATKVWTPLSTGDFQIIQSNSGIQHQERIEKGSRAFQIWFDPHFYQAIQKKPTYSDYRSQDFLPKLEHGLNTITYIGEGSIAKSITPGLSIKKLLLETKTKTSITLKEDSSYTFYILSGEGKIGHLLVEKDDAIRINHSSVLEIDFQGELFCIQTPAKPDYKPIWLA